VALKAGLAGESMAAPVIPSLLVAEAARQKVSARPLLRGLHFDVVDLDKQSDMISHRAAITVVRRSLRLLALADLGHELGLTTRVTQWGILALGLLAAPAPGDAIRLSLRYPQRAGYLVQIREEKREDQQEEPHRRPDGRCAWGTLADGAGRRRRTVHVGLPL